MKYTYYKGSCDNPETVEFEITKHGQYITTCVVNIDLLLCGISTFPCSNGRDIKLALEQQLEILETMQTQRKKSMGGNQIKTMNGWEKSGVRLFEEYCTPGDIVDQEIVDHFVNSVPPVLLRASCTQCGEVYSHERDELGNYRPTYTTFQDLGDGTWQYNGNCFHGENKNRANIMTRLEKCMEKILKKRLEGNNDE